VSGPPEETVWEGRFIATKRRGKWEYVSRTRGVSAVVILALDGEYAILVEQYRVPLGRNCIELPAGLIGDDAPGEAAEDAAIRELEEETGYRAAHMVNLGRFHASPKADLDVRGSAQTLYRGEESRSIAAPGALCPASVYGPTFIVLPAASMRRVLLAPCPERADGARRLRLEVCRRSAEQPSLCGYGEAA
jgi:ADP-ribose pyrophosphatase